MTPRHCRYCNGLMLLTRLRGYSTSLPRTRRTLILPCPQRPQDNQRYQGLHLEIGRGLRKPTRLYRHFFETLYVLSSTFSSGLRSCTSRSDYFSHIRVILSDIFNYCSLVERQPRFKYTTLFSQSRKPRPFPKTLNVITRCDKVILSKHLTSLRGVIATKQSRKVGSHTNNKTTAEDNL